MKAHILVLFTFLFFCVPCYAEHVPLTLREGFNGYSGTEDVAISADGKLKGRNFGAEHSIWIWQHGGVSLIRFDLSAIPKTAKINAAELDLFCFSVGFAKEEIDRPWSIGVFQCRQSWTEGTGGIKVVSGQGAMLNTSDGIKAWMNGRVTAAAGPRMGVTEHKGADVKWYTWKLKPEPIQRWLDREKTNHGFMVWGKPPGKAISFTSSESTSVQQRPTLRLHLDIPDNDVLKLGRLLSSGIPWKQFRTDCGVEAQKKNEALTEDVFRNRYLNRYVEWTGYVASVSEQNKNDYRVQMRMEPTDSSIGGADLSLLVPAGLKQVLLMLKKNDKVRFLGKIKKQGGVILNHELIILSITHDD